MTLALFYVSQFHLLLHHYRQKKQFVWFYFLTDYLSKNTEGVSEVRSLQKGFEGSEQGKRGAARQTGSVPHLEESVSALVDSRGRLHSIL